MNDREFQPPKPALPDKARARAERERRLAEALRANLRRRKEQSRGRAQPSAPPRGNDEEA